ncbi:MAG: helix-turn-helix transcriptional regulator, partial [Clostridia bacterium]
CHHGDRLYHKRRMAMIRILLSTRLGERRWTQADLARKTGIRPNTINELYHELAVRVTLEHLDLICEALGCELSDLIVRVPNQEQTVLHTRSGIKVREW